MSLNKIKHLNKLPLYVKVLLKKIYKKYGYQVTIGYIKNMQNIDNYTKNLFLCYIDDLNLKFMKKVEIK